eukprot:GFYU01001449.1.p1 GENE.GFYU01001449.1~~GFYU01001449.1.p1  ORF type:complete len:152 (-),score=12.88 GFYU01001449.1:130-585(-)
MSCPIELKHATEHLVSGNGEKRSKLLLPGSQLYDTVKRVQDALRQHGLEFKERMDLHVEVLTKDDECTREVVESRCVQIRGRELSLNKRESWRPEGRSFALDVGPIDGYRFRPHITVAFLNRRLEPEFVAKLQDIALGVVHDVARAGPDAP